MSQKYIVGIDLGTTNSALAYSEATAAEKESRIEISKVPQLANPGELAARTLLPSFLYIPAEFDFPKGSLALPWNPEPKFVIGELARKRGAENPNRLVASAKSWLSYAAANRTAPILPWQAPEEVPKLSPVEASSQFLQYLRNVWDSSEAAAQGQLSLGEQDVLLTVPASFDEEARELTRRAAEQADYHHVTLLEEPQAAFYAWLESQGEGWRQRIKVGDLVLVCDIGGGTTDFSLIMVSEESGDLTLKRVAVGEHILLGGDNMDLALARFLQQRLQSSGHRIDMWQLQALWHQCRAAKEKLFESSKTQTITLLGKGTKLVGGTIKTELAREDLDQIVVEGFFPKVAASELPARQRRVGFQELGLPYAADPAVTKHLALFLSEQVRNSPEAANIRRGRSGLACPTHILFNGGVMKATVLQERVVEVLNSWLRDEGFDTLGAEHILEAPDLEHAVARGAAYYGQARRGRGMRIRSGASRTYYVGIESSMPAIPGMEAPLKALCVVPFGMEEGTEAMISDREFGLVVGEPAEFRFLSSTVRKQDKVGSLLEEWGDDIEERSPLQVTLKVDGQQGQVIPVRLESRVTEVGTLEVWCVARDGHRWKLELNIREKAGRETAGREKARQ